MAHPPDSRRIRRVRHRSATRSGRAARRAGRALLRFTVAAAATVICAAPALADDPADTPVASAPASGPATTAGPEKTVSSTGDLTAAQQRIAALQAAVDRQTSAVAKAESAVAAAAAAASVQLEIYSSAVRAMGVAQLQERRLGEELAVADARLADSRADLGRLARSAYSDGDVLADSGLVRTLLTSSTTDQIGTDLVTLGRLGTQRKRTVDAVQASVTTQSRAREAAARSATEAAVRAVAAGRAKDAADAAVATQRNALATLQDSLATGLKSVAQARSEAQLAAARVSANALVGPVGDCAGADDLSQYGNGQIPLTALCPLWGTANHYLRADAAEAFNRLSEAYASQFGTPVCVTDSYRTYAQQVDLKVRKPDLAATPGTSNHGWGTATDLCGGIEQFDSPTHRWLLANAPLYGWFHPAWAEPTGSRPEPWHWEYSG